jgi:hypothetical protein
MRRSRSFETDWGGSFVTSSPQAKALAKSATVGQRILCWQNWNSESRPKSVAKRDRSAAVGIVEISRITNTADGETSWTLRLLEEFDPPVPLLRYRTVSPELKEPFVNPQRQRTFYELSPECEKAVLRTCRSTLTTSRYAASGKIRKDPPKAGGGFGDAENNKKVEKAAINAATRRLRMAGWKVSSVESLNLGFDLLAEKGNQRREIEVKGVRGTRPEFIITANEVAASKLGNSWELWVVTEALSSRPKIQKFAVADFKEKFELKPLSYKALRK